MVKIAEVIMFAIKAFSSEMPNGTLKKSLVEKS